MDERIARLKTAKDARQVAENARLKGRLDLQAEALEFAKVLQVKEDGYTRPVEAEIAAALYSYEEVQSHLKNQPNYSANRLRPMLKARGPVETAEHTVLQSKNSSGFEVLKAAGKLEATFEAIVTRYPHEFSEEALAAAQARLRGEPPPRRSKSKASPSLMPDTASSAPPPPAKLDAEAKVFWSSMRDSSSRFMADWLPQYKRSAQEISDALSAGRFKELFETIWKSRDNHVANPGRGALNYAIDDEIRKELIKVISEVYADGSADNFETIINRFESWREEKRIPWIPRLLLARAFAAIHPDEYHTTVDGGSQDDVIPWFVEHTGFVEPESRNWAGRAQALTAHLSRIEELGEDIFVRNMFPWFVAEQVSARKPATGFQPGHKPRAASVFADMPAHQREIKLRHYAVQAELYKRLAAQFGEDKVGTERPTGTGGFADALVQLSEGEHYLYEIKIADTAREVVRQAMGQLLEYGFRKGGLNPVKLFVVGEPELDETTADFIGRLRDEFNMELDYLRVALNEPLATSSP